MIAVAGLFIQAQNPVQPIKPRLEALGVCRIDDDGASCWSLEGVPDAALTTRINRSVREPEASFAFVPGRKNRFLVVRCESVYSWSAEATTGRAGLYPLKLGSDYSGMAMRVDSSAATAAATVTAKLGVFSGKPVEIEFRRGQRGRVEDVNFALGNPVASSSFFQFWMPTGVAWKFDVEILNPKPSGDLTFEAFARNGRPIRFVDGWGKPDDSEKAEALWQQLLAGTYRWDKQENQYPATIQRAHGESGFTYVTNIDAKAIARLHVRRVSEHIEKIGPFPLDPLQSKVP